MKWDKEIKNEKVIKNNYYLQKPEMVYKNINHGLFAKNIYRMKQGSLQKTIKYFALMESLS